MKMINENTASLCNVCYSEIPARVYEEDGQVFIRKICRDHGGFTGLVEKDAAFYHWFVNTPPADHLKFNSLLMPITFRCNMNCKYCFSWFPEGKDIPLEDIVDIARDFEGKGVGLSGGEPTVREDLGSIISAVKRAGKNVQIVTNGLKLSDPKYLQSLLDAGLDSVFFSLDSFDKGFYRTMKESRLKNEATADLKMEALKNLEAKKVRTLLSVTIYPGLNDKEIKDLFVYAFGKSHFFHQLRFRSCVGGRQEQARAFQCILSLGAHRPVREISRV